MKWHCFVKSRRLAGIAVALCLFVSIEAAAQDARPVVSATSVQKTEAAFKMREMIANGWPILSVLLVMSILSIGIIVERIIIVKKTEEDASSLLPEVLRMVEAGKGATEIIAECEKVPHPVAMIVSRVVKDAGDKELMDRVAQRTIQTKIRELETRVPSLGTIASTAPFVGLLGTVIGIIKAFGSIAANSSGGPGVVASGIAEALITTAFGLFVAIPAVMGYNHLVHRVERLAMDIDVSVAELIDHMNKKKK